MSNIFCLIQLKKTQTLYKVICNRNFLAACDAFKLVFLISFRPNNFSASSGIEVCQVGSSVVLKQVVCVLSTPDSGKKFLAVLKFGNGLTYRIKAGKRILPGSLQGQQALLELEICEFKEAKKFMARVLSVLAKGQTYTLHCLQQQQQVVTSENLTHGQVAAAAVQGTAGQGPAVKGTAVSQLQAPASKPPASLTAKKKTLWKTVARFRTFIVLKCFTMLAKQKPCCLPFDFIQVMLMGKFSDLTVNALIDIAVEYSDIFQLLQNSFGEQLVQLKPLDSRAVRQLLSLGTNVKVHHNPQHPYGANEHQHPDLAARVSVNTIIMDGLEGHYYTQTGESVIVFSCGSSQLFVTFAATAAMRQQLPQGQSVTVCLKIYAVGPPEVHVDPLALTAQLAPGQQIKLFTSEGVWFNFSSKGHLVPVSSDAMVPSTKKGIQGNRSLEQSKPVYGGAPSSHIDIPLQPLVPSSLDAEGRGNFKIIMYEYIHVIYT